MMKSLLKIVIIKNPKLILFYISIIKVEGPILVKLTSISAPKAPGFNL